MNKKIYNSPAVCKIDIDAEISLQLESQPPIPGNETNLFMHDSYILNPMKDNLSKV